MPLLSLCQWNAISYYAGSKSATFHVQLGVLSCTVNRACVSASLGRSVHVVVSLRKSTTDTYLWGRPDSGCLTRVRYRHLTRPSSSCEGRLRQTMTLAQFSGREFPAITWLSLVHTL